MKAVWFGSCSRWAACSSAVCAKLFVRSTVLFESCLFEHRLLGCWPSFATCRVTPGGLHTSKAAVPSMTPSTTRVASNDTGPIEGHLPSRRWHQALLYQALLLKALLHQRPRPHQTAQPPGSMASCAHERLLRGLSPRWVFSRSPFSCSPFSRSLVPRGPCPRSLSPDCLPLPPLDVPDGPLTTRAGQRTSSVTQRHAMTNRRA